MKGFLWGAAPGCLWQSLMSATDCSITWPQPVRHPISVGFQRWVLVLTEWPIFAISPG